MRFFMTLMAALSISLVAVAPPAKADPVVAAFIGDSYTEGYKAPDGGRWSTLVAQQLGWDERNYGRGGTGYVTASPYGPPFADMIQDAAADNPDVVVVQGGVNDRHPAEDTPDAVARAVADTYRRLRMRLPKARIIAVGPTFTSHVTPALVAFDAAVQTAAAAIGAQYVSMIAPTLVIQPDMLLDDQLHLDAEGHQAIADRIVSSIRR